jgi:aspartate aminotransferase
MDPSRAGVSIPFAARMDGIGDSRSQGLIARVRALRAAGADVIDFGQQGPPPRVAVEAARAALDAPGSAFYSDTRGAPGLRRAIADKLAAENGFAADPDSEIIVTVGAKEALFATLLALVGPGDEVVLEDPGYLGFEPLIRLAGATPVPVALRAAEGFRLPIDRLRAAITPRTRVLLLCTPHNPTGRVLSAEELDAVAALVRDAGIVAVMDEAYEHFVFDGRPHLSLAALPGMRARTVTVQTISKVYNMAGWRIGWLAAPPDIAQRVVRIHTHAATCPATMAQAGAEAAIRAGLGEGDLPFAEIAANYARQRDAMVAGLRAIPGVSCALPEGGYFVFPDFSSFGLDSLAMSDHLLSAARVAATPGIAFGAAGEGHARLVIKAGVDEIRRGVARIATALAAIRSGDAQATRRS